MIRVDFTDGDGKYVNSAYTPEGDWTEESLHQVLHFHRKQWQVARSGGSEESFVDFLIRRRLNFYPKTSAVYHFAI